MDGTTQPPGEARPAGAGSAVASRGDGARPSASELQPFGKYLLDEEIARGGMARVYRARLRGLGGFEKTLVVKQILPELARDPRFVAMFVEEAKTLVAMSHPGIVPVFELGIVDGTYFLAMEHVDGATLADLLAEGGPLAPGLVAQIGAATSEALQYAHERFGLVHRDVTPRNVMIDAGGHVRLLDFGIAAPVSGEGTGEIFGSHGYMAPEQLRGETLSPRSDVFSLGCVLFEALSGTPAFFRGDAESSRAALLDGPAPSLAAVGGAPEELCAIVERALARAPADRFESAEALGRRLRAWLAQAHPEGVTRALGERAARAQAWRAQRRHAQNHAPTRAEKTPRRDPSGVVRTLAQSRALDALLTAPMSRDDARRSGATVEGTAPLPRDEARRSGATVEGTAPLARAAPRPEAAPPELATGAEPGLAAQPGGQAGARTAPVAQAPARRPPGQRAAAPWIAVGVLAAGAAGLAVWAARPPGTTGESAGVGAGAGAEGRMRGGATPRGSPEAGPGEGAATGPGVGSRASDAGGSPAETAPDGGAGGGEAAGGAAGSGPAQGRETGSGAAGDEADGADAGTMTDAGVRVAPAYLAVNAVPWAEVRVDGRSVGTTPRRNLPVTPGAAHVVELSCPPLGRSARVTVRPAAGATTRVLVDLSRDPPAVTVSP